MVLQLTSPVLRALRILLFISGPLPLDERAVAALEARTARSRSELEELLSERAHNRGAGFSFSSRHHHASAALITASGVPLPADAPR